MSFNEINEASFLIKTTNVRLHLDEFSIYIATLIL